MAFGDSIKLGNIQENWLFKLANNNSGYLYMSFSSVVYSSNYYEGVILNKPTISDTISLSKSTAATSGISIKIPDYNYNGSPISKELWGTNSYINRVCTVHSQINNDTPNQIGSFRVNGLSSDGKAITIKMISYRPWDNVTVPNVKSPKGNYFPVAYGDFTVNTSTVSSPAFCTSKDLYPAPVEQVQNFDFLALQPKNTSEGKLHFYDKSSDTFIPLDDVNSSSVALGDGYTNSTTVDLHRAYKLRPNSIISTDDYDDYDDNGAETIDSDDSTFSLLNFAMGDGTLSSANRQWSKTTTVNANVSQIQHKIDEYKTGFTFAFTLDIEAIGDSGDTFNIAFAINDKTTGSYVAVKSYSYVGTFVSVGQHDLTSTGIIVTGDQDSTNNLISVAKDTHFSNDFEANIKGLSTDSISYQVSWLFYFTGNQGTSGRQFTAVDIDFKMYDTFIQPKLKIPTNSTDKAEYNSVSESIANVETLYSGSDGLTRTYTGSSGVATEIHEAHRALLKDHAGLDDSDADIDGWSALDSSKDWKIRYWLTEPTLLKDVLNKLQYEGGFIFRDRFGVPQYIHIPDSISGVITLTKYDIANIVIENTPLSEISTKQNIGYQKHPAENRYLTNVTSTNSTPRTTYNIQAKENIEEVSLDAYVSPTIPTSPANSGNKANRNDDHYSYYNAINGDVFFSCSFDLVNPAFYDLEVGSFIVFDNDNMYPESPFGQSSGTWTNLNMMIVSTRRTPGKLSIKAREI
jgi:hypothetical protein